MSAIDKLAELFKRFPGIGERQARRFVYFLLSRDDSFLTELSRRIVDLKNAVRICTDCKRHFEARSEVVQCNVCLDENRDRRTLIIVEKDADLDQIERSGTYRGTYFVLGGVVPILEKEPACRIRQHELLTKLESLGPTLDEVVFALSVNAAGENTREYLSGLLSPIAQKHSFRLSNLGRGLSTGSELEYADKETIKNALEGRA